MCTIKLDAVERTDENERLALIELGPSLKILFKECVEPRKGLLAKGIIRVGLYQTLGLMIAPTPTALALNSSVKQTF